MSHLPPSAAGSSPVITPNLYKPLPSPQGLSSPPSHLSPSADLPSLSTGALASGVTPLSQAGSALEGQQEGRVPTAGTHQGRCWLLAPGGGTVPSAARNMTPTFSPGAPPGQTPNGPPALTLIQSTSFLDSVPVTLTLEPRDLLGVEESAGGPPPIRGAGPGAVSKEGRGAKTVEVELRRRPGEGFGFVIASQEVTSGGELVFRFKQ